MAVSFLFVMRFEISSSSRLRTVWHCYTMQLNNIRTFAAVYFISDCAGTLLVVDFINHIQQKYKSYLYQP